MRIKVLGSGASEGIPAIFCNCDSCIKAREAGGKNIRTRSQFYVDDDLMIDFGDDTFCHSLKKYNPIKDEVPVNNAFTYRPLQPYNIPL